MMEAYQVKPEILKSVEDPKGFAEALELVGELVSERLRKFAAGSMANYLWKYREGRKRIGICDACQAVMVLGKDGSYRAGGVVECDSCGVELIVKDIGRKRLTMTQHFYVQDWRRIDESTVAVVGAEVSRDSRGENPERAPIDIWPSCVAIYRFGRGVTAYKRRRREYAKCEDGQYRSIQPPWRRVRKWTGALSYGMSLADIKIKKGDDWMKAAIRGTRFGTVWDCAKLALRQFPRQRWFLDDCSLERIARYPCIEYLAKMGQHELVRDLLYDSIDQGAINPRGKTAGAVLKLDGQQLREVKEKKLVLTRGALRYAQFVQRYGVRVPLSELVTWGDESYRLHRLEAWFERLPDAMRRPAIKYIAKGRRAFVENGWRAYDDPTRDLLDYWDQLGELDADLSDEAVLLPRDLGEVHARATARVRHARDPELDKELQKRLGRLRVEYGFAHDGLVLAPIESVELLIYEGTKLRHCVGGYAHGYATGRTVICSLRWADEPDEPWRTVEFSAETGKLAQDRGYQNDMGGMDDGLKDKLAAFWAAFEAWRADHRGRRTA